MKALLRSVPRGKPPRRLARTPEPEPPPDPCVTTMRLLPLDRLGDVPAAVGTTRRAARAVLGAGEVLRAHRDGAVLAAATEGPA